MEVVPTATYLRQRIVGGASGPLKKEGNLRIHVLSKFQGIRRSFLTLQFPLLRTFLFHLFINCSSYLNRKILHFSLLTRFHLFSLERNSEGRN